MIKISKVKDKERILKAEREKQLLTYKGTPIKQSADFPAGQKGVARYIQSAERRKLPTKNTLPGKVIQN